MFGPTPAFLIPDSEKTFAAIDRFEKQTGATIHVHLSYRRWDRQPAKQAQSIVEAIGFDQKHDPAIMIYFNPRNKAYSLAMNSNFRIRFPGIIFEKATRLFEQELRGTHFENALADFIEAIMLLILSSNVKILAPQNESHEDDEATPPRANDKIMI